MEDLGGGVEVTLGFDLVAEDAVGKIGNVHAGEGVDSVSQERGVLVGVVQGISPTLEEAYLPNVDKLVAKVRELASY